ncbi:MAG: adenylate kinase [Firmicutes bacterium]|nr:adenylate kinase [Bacillota bacterium]MCM1401823.1 adenylate kinase [Bacteroides sp.]MCM1477941.1 adenylate kinase [Bacteroides sp.]
MYNLVVFGAPGSGKGTQSARLIDEYGLYHISTGELLRDHIARETALGKVANEYISKGHLIPDELMIEILENTLDSNPATANGVIFDGFPRTIHQADTLNEMLERRGAKVDAVVGLEVDDKELIDRLLKRGEESGRSDDNLETINERLNVYNAQTAPLREYYIKQGKYHGVKGSGSIDDIFNDIRRQLKHTRQAQEASCLS